jgi:enamine deaminase RidA (YjgF/YER057c/UK114 family)
VFCSGTVGIDPSTASLAEGISEQTERALKSLGNPLVSAGSSMSHLAKTTLYYASWMTSPLSMSSAPATCLTIRLLGLCLPMWRCHVGS